MIVGMVLAVALTAGTAPSRPYVSGHDPAYRCNHHSRRWTQRETRCVIRVVFRRRDAAAALAIARCESHDEPRLVSPTDDYGVFQINRPSHPDYFLPGWRWRHRFDPVYNARYAYRMSRGGWQAWVCARILGIRTAATERPRAAPAAAAPVSPRSLPAAARPARGPAT